jgi:hypothetical protein
VFLLSAGEVIGRSQDGSRGGAASLEPLDLSKLALEYRPNGRRNIGLPRKRWGTKFILRIKEQETRLTLHEHDDDDDDEINFVRAGFFNFKTLKLNKIYAVRIYSLL